MPLAVVAFFATAQPCTPALDAQLTDISLRYRQTHELPTYATGALVHTSGDGLESGDVIQGVGDDLVQNVCDVRQAFAKRGCGAVVRLAVRRGTRTIDVDVRLHAARSASKPPGDCDLGDGDACYALALKLGNTPDGAAAYEQACDAGNAEACTNLGWIAQNGAGMRTDLEAAVRLFQRGCDGSACSGRNELGCVNLGRLYRDGIGVKADEARGVAIFRQVCDRGSADASRACSLAGTTLLFGKTLAHDRVEGLALLEKGCTGGDSFGCFNLGAIYETADGVPKDVARAAAYYRKACDGGDAEACDRLGALKK